MTTDDERVEKALESTVESDENPDETPAESSESTGGLADGASADGSTKDESNPPDPTDHEEDDGPSTTVEIAVEPNQKAVWQNQAEQAKLSLSEYVVTMVETGRMSVRMEPSNQGPGTEELEDRVRAVLREDQYLSWDELVETLSREFEENVEGALQKLQADDEVRYSGLHDGYTLVGDE